MPRASSTPSTALTRRLSEWFSLHGRHDLPWRHELSPYRVLVSEIMLQQTQVPRVKDYFTRWMARFPDLRSLASAPLDEVYQLWQGLGYYRRARSLHELARSVVNGNGEVELGRDPEALKHLPGIGPYTAAAVGAFACDRPEPAMDTNVRRVAGRVLGVEGTNNESQEWVESVQRQLGGRFGLSAVMDLGALVCTAKVPRCGECPLRRWCTSSGNVTTAQPGPKSVRHSATAWAIGIPCHANRLILRRDGTGILRVPATNDGAARTGLKQAFTSALGVAVAVRPGCGRIAVNGKTASVHRCSLVQQDQSGFTAAPETVLESLPKWQLSAIRAANRWPKN